MNVKTSERIKWEEELKEVEKSISLIDEWEGDLQASIYKKGLEFLLAYVKEKEDIED